MDVVTLALAKKGAKSYTDTVINNLPKGVVYKGSVNYYADLPSAAALGDCYTVAYKGTTGTEPYGAEYIWGLNTATNIREWIKIGEEIDLSKYATQDWVNTQISDFLPDVETYKTAELTEGQITDVIGVNDIKIKGQTSQAGEPTPDSPVDVNVVSGSNVINIYNGQTLSKELPLDLPVENLFDKNNVNYISAYINTNNNQFSTSNTVKTYYIPCKPNTTYTIQKILTAQFRVGTSENEPIVNGDALQAWANNNATQYTITTNSNANYLCICVHNSSTDTLLEETVLNTIQIEQGSKANAYTPYGTDPIELCKIGNYQDYFYKSGSKWYLHKEMFKIVLDGTENFDNTYTAFRYVSSKIKKSISGGGGICNYYLYDKRNSGMTNLPNGYFAVQTLSADSSSGLYFRNTNFTSADDFKSDLVQKYANGKPVILYYPLATAIDTEITDTTLISQLEAIYNAPLYEQTNITQINNDLPIILDITACKDNINGIKAFIRK